MIYDIPTNATWLSIGHHIEFFIQTPHWNPLDVTAHMAPFQMSPASGMQLWEFKLTGRKAQFRILVFGSKIAKKNRPKMEEMWATKKTVVV